jgi:hypothetical protein
MNTKCIIFGPMDQKLWVFEVLGQGLAMAGMCWSQQELTTCSKSGGQEGKKIPKKWGQPNMSWHRPAAATRPRPQVADCRSADHSRPATSSCPPATDRR